MMHTPALQKFIRTLEQITDATIRRDMFVIETLETGGSYIPVRAGDNWASHLVEINLHNITATGTTDEEAIRNWIRAAHRAVPATVGAIPFSTPRNHDEEIANARAAEVA